MYIQYRNMHLFYAYMYVCVCMSMRIMVSVYACVFEYLQSTLYAHTQTDTNMYITAYTTQSLAFPYIPYNYYK